MKKIQIIYVVANAKQLDQILKAQNGQSSPIRNGDKKLSHAC